MKFLLYWSRGDDKEWFDMQMRCDMQIKEIDI